MHHRLPRGMGGTDLPHWSPARLLLLCGHGTAGCHGRTESRRRWAYSYGLLVPRPAAGLVDQLAAEDAACEAWPFLLLRRRRVFLTADGRYLCRPEPEPATPPRPDLFGWSSSAGAWPF